ncbi:hypothetical protein [Candidatus Nitrosocosmicus sp. T]
MNERICLWKKKMKEPGDSSSIYGSIEVIVNPRLKLNYGTIVTITDN